MKYAVVIESSETGFGAYVPDLPGCVAVAESIEETEDLIREAIVLHLDGFREDGLEIPPATSRANNVEIA
jgi:predicted RNase H-like HicB family nuclease